MDEKAARAEELLEERLRSRPNGHSVATESPADDAEGAPRDLTADLQRLAADFSNYRKRNEADRAEFAKYAKSDLIAKLLDVLDGYDRALATMPDETKTQPWVEGMWLVERKLRQILEQEGLQAIDALGRPFDPRLHEAVAHLESDKPEGTVIEEYQKAYKLHDRVIRPALVAVAKSRGAGDAEGQGPRGGTPGAHSKEG